MRNLLFFILIGLSFTGCGPDKIEDFGGGPGKRPIYISPDLLDNVKTLPPQPVGALGTIFWKDSLFFALEYKKGIHVLNIIDSTNTQAVAFWQIPAITDFTISGNYLYADGWKDLLIIDIHNIQNIVLVSRTRNAFEPLLFPPLYDGKFECYDPSRGAIGGWEDVELDAYLCQTTN